MKVRRVVTATDQSGKARVVSDGSPPLEQALQHTPGFVCSPLWLTTQTPDLNNATDPTVHADNLLAPAAGSTFLVVTFPPDSVMMSPDFDPAKAGPEHAAAAPGIAETFELEHPGMHRTPTLDYVTVVSGQIVLELDDGATVQLSAGDTVIQHGVRHAWRNPGQELATVSFVMLGAKAA